MTAAGKSTSWRMQAEWEPHEATWIAWPHHEPDWPGRFEPIPWVYAEIVRVLSTSERVEILCHDERVEAQARECLNRTGVDTARYRLHRVPTDRSWLRDSAPTGVRGEDGSVVWMHWRFNAWAKYDNYHLDVDVPPAVERITKRPRIEPVRPDNGERLVVEGGAIETDGAGTLIVTEECLLSDVQCRNPRLTREGYEQAFAEYLGVRKVIWLGGGCAGDDTHGHIDDVARFVGSGTVVLAYEDDPSDVNHASSVDNLCRLQSATDASGRPIRVVMLPMPRAIVFDGDRVPASYANFYIANEVVLVPTFNDPNDRIALNTLADLFPTRQVIGIHAVELVWGNGTLHCLTQQEPSGK